MARPTTKDDLLKQAQQNYDKLQQEIEHLSEEELVVDGIVGDWSIKDVLAHLLAWQQMTLDWYRAGCRGETPITPSEKYTWREIPALNQEIYETWRDQALDAIRADLQASHENFLSVIETLSNETLFTAKVYPWTKSTTLGSYFTSATSSHYDWARKEIRRGLKTKRSQKT